MSEHDTPWGGPPPADPPAADPQPEPDTQPERSLEDRVGALERLVGIPAGAHPAVGRPTVSVGSADPAVTELTAKLNELGYEVPVGPTVTLEVINVVNAFRRKYDVDDAVESIPEGYSPEVRSRWIGPETWAAILAA